MESNQCYTDAIQKLQNAFREKPSNHSKLFEILATVRCEFSSVDTCIEEKIDSVKIKSYTRVIDVLLENYSIDWMSSGEPDENLNNLVYLIMKDGHAESTLFSLVSKISSMSTNVECLQLISHLESLIKNDKFIQKIISMHCSESLPVKNSSEVKQTRAGSALQWNSTLSLIASMPDVILPKCHLHSSSEFFNPITYISSVCCDIQHELQKIYINLQSGRNSSVTFISALLGKLSAVGYGSLLWDNILNHNKRNICRDFLWQRIWQTVINDVSDQWIEQFVVPFLKNAKSCGTVKYFFGVLPANKIKLNFVLTQKLLLFQYYETSCVVQNIITYLASDAVLEPLFKKAFESLMQAFADGSSVRHRPWEQSLYICKAIVVSIACIRQNQELEKAVKDCIRSTLLKGLPNYLDSTEHKIRQMGCCVGEMLGEFLRISDAEDHKLKFDLDSDEITEELKSLLILPEYNENDSICDDDVISKVEKLKVDDAIDTNNSEYSSDRNKNGSVLNDKKCDNMKSKLIQELDSDDEEDDLKPLPGMSQPLRNKKQPMYISQCLDGLIHAGDDVELLEQCLNSAESLVRNHPEVKEIAAEMTKVLLHLEDRFNLPDFLLNRHRTMVALVVMSPDSVVPYLTGEFYAVNYNISQRLDMLNVLSDSVRELSQCVTVAGKDLKSVKSLDVNSSVDKNSLRNSTTDYSSLSSSQDVVKSWQDIVQERIESKTRRFAHGPTRAPPVASNNKLTPVIGLFFYPLIRDFDRTDRGNHLDLLDRDHILLQTLLHTLGAIMYAAINTPSVGALARALMEFSWCLRGHRRASVRQGVLYAVCMTVAAVPSGVLVERLTEEIGEMRDWLNDVMSNDADSECRLLASQCLHMLCSAIQNELTNSK